MLIALASYPKSGNTWMRALLQAAMSDPPGQIRLDALEVGSLNAGSREVFETATGLDIDTLTNAEILARRPAVFDALAASAKDTPVFLKTHDANLPAGQEDAPYRSPPFGGAIYLVRHPLDVAVSYAAHSGLGIAETVAFMIDADAHIADYLPAIAKSGRRPLGQVPQPVSSWAGHVQSWADQAPKPCIWVRYEDLLSDTAGELDRVDIGLGLGLGRDRIAAAVLAAKFERLQEAEARHGFPEAPRRAERFFRQGASGDGRSVPAQVSECLWSDVKRPAVSLGYPRVPSNRLRRRGAN